MAPVLRISNEPGILRAQPRAHQWWQHSPWVWEGFSAPGRSVRGVCCAQQSRGSQALLPPPAPGHNRLVTLETEPSRAGLPPAFLPVLQGCQDTSWFGREPLLAPGWSLSLPWQGGHGTHGDAPAAAGSFLLAQQKPGRAAG